MCFIYGIYVFSNSVCFLFMVFMCYSWYLCVLFMVFICFTNTTTVCSFPSGGVMIYFDRIEVVNFLIASAGKPKNTISHQEYTWY